MNILTGQKDADLMILEKLNDKSLLNFCLVNQDANCLCSKFDKELWRNRLLRKYGKESLEFKSPERTWKQFYLLILNWNCDIHSGMYCAAFEGHKDLVDFFISKGANDWDWGMFSAAEGGHKDLVDFFISKGANSWNWAMHSAALGGHKDLVDFFKQKLNE